MRRLGTDCETCHNTRNWRDWDFNHDKTRFRLLNKHATLQCVECHATPVAEKIGQLQGCAVCHGMDDTHNGAFGGNCDRCHTDLAWQNIKIGSMRFVTQDSDKGQTDKDVSIKPKSTKQQLGKKKKKKAQQ